MNGRRGRHELWGTFSVRDHVRVGAFVAEVLLYDHLVIPVPPKEEPYQPSEWDRREANDWYPERQREILNILGDSATEVPWTAQWRHEWEGAAHEISARREMAGRVATELPIPIEEMDFILTGQLLQKVTPAMADGVVAVYYDSLGAFQDDLGLSPSNSILPGDALSVAIGRTFLMPQAVGDLDQLKRAVEVAHDPKYRERRRALYAWQQQFLTEAGTTDPPSIQKALDTMAKLVNDLDTSTEEQTAWTRLKRAFLFAQIGTGIASSIAMPPLAVANAAIALGQYVTTGKLANRAKPDPEVPSAALLVEARRDLGLPGYFTPV